MIARIALVACLVCACSRAGEPAPPRTFEAGRLGTVRLFRGAGPPRAFVFLFSDASGWNPDLERVSAALAREGASVVGIDLPEYERRLAASGDGCHYVVAGLEDLSHRSRP